MGNRISSISRNLQELERLKISSYAATVIIDDDSKEGNNEFRTQLTNKLTEVLVAL